MNQGFDLMIVAKIMLGRRIVPRVGLTTMFEEHSSMLQGRTKAGGVRQDKSNSFKNFALVLV